MPCPRESFIIYCNVPSNTKKTLVFTMVPETCVLAHVDDDDDDDDDDYKMHSTPHSRIIRKIL